MIRSTSPIVCVSVDAKFQGRKRVNSVCLLMTLKVRSAFRGDVMVVTGMTPVDIFVTLSLAT